MRRRARLPTPSGSSKSVFSTQEQAAIDSCLKSLRTASRKLRPLHEALQDDLRVLERLYYKGKNQHHPSIFWRNVAEVRRIGQRIKECRIGWLVDTLRLGFYDVLPETSPRSRTKTLKGAWTRVPTSPFTATLLGRLRDIASLLNKTLEVTQRSYEGFVLSMQNTAFITQAVALMAITARIYHVAYESRELLDTIWVAGLACVQIVEPEAIAKRRLPENLPASRVSTGAELRPLPFVESKTILEDTGVVVSSLDRRDVASPNKCDAASIVLLEDDLGASYGTSETAAQSAPVAASDRRDETTIFSPLTGDPFRDSQQPPSDSHGQSVLDCIPIPTSITSANMIQKRGESSILQAGPKPKRKKKAKRNEIDDIFG